MLPLALNNLALVRIFEGDLEAAAALVEESDAIADVTGAGRITFGWLILAGFRGDESAVSEQIEPTRRPRPPEARAAAHRRRARPRTAATTDSAVMTPHCPRQRAAASADALCHNGLVVARARRGGCPLRQDRPRARPRWSVSAKRTQAAGTEWALGIEARSRALLSDGPQAEELYREAIDRLGRCRIAPERARAHLLYGEWLRREGRRVDAREQLRTAHDMLAAIGMEAFAERARRELAATGEKVRRRRAETRDDLTAQETQIAQLARDGLLEPGDRRPAVPEPTHRRVAHAQGLREARH